MLNQTSVRDFFTGGVALTVQAGIKSDRVLAAIITHTPAPRLVAEGEQLKTAGKTAARMTNAQAFWGIGRSMEPLCDQHRRPRPGDQI